MRWGPGISPSYYEHGPWLLSKENKRKIDPTENPSCLIPRLLVVFTQQLEILVTTLQLAKHINPLSPRSDQCQISPFNITAL